MVWHLCGCFVNETPLQLGFSRQAHGALDVVRRIDHCKYLFRHAGQLATCFHLVAYSETFFGFEQIPFAIVLTTFRSHSPFYHLQSTANHPPHNHGAFVQTSIGLLLAFATISNGVTDAANLRQDERSLAATYTSSAQYASAMLARINKERNAHKLPPVCSNRKLLVAAQRHVKDQAKTEYMSDFGTDNSTPEQRVTDAGYKWQSVVESIDSRNADVDSVVDWWMKNADRDHILGKYTMVGTAYAFNDNTYNKHYWVQVFATGSSEACDA